MIKGILFDFDGTIVDSEKSRLYSLNKVLENFKLKISKNAWEKKYMRLNSKPILNEILTLNNIEEDIDLLYEYSRKIRKDYIRENSVKLINGFLEFYQQIKKNDIKMIVCSGGKRDHIKFNMQMANLPEDIEYLGREDYEKVKPEPDCYIRGMQMLGLEKNEVIAIDDSYNGILAAKNAGIDVIGINCEKEKGIDELEPLMKVKDYTQIDLDKLLNLNIFRN